MTACSHLPPATAPPQLTHTPGAFVKVAGGHFNAGNFQFDYPESWKLIKSSAAATTGMQIILRAPTGGELSLQVVETNRAAEGFFIPLAKGNYLLATIHTTEDSSSTVAPEFERIIRSIRS